MGSKGVALVVAVIGVIALAAAGVYLYRHQGAAPQVEDKVATGETPGAEPAKPAESKPTAVPSFDVVRIEPTGEGVIAGRAEPGWTMALEDGGAKIAETKVDEEGAWSIVLDKPLSQGEHSLTLRATAPDGTQGVTGQQPVNVAVGKPGEAVVAQKESEPAKETPPEAPAPEQQAAAPEPQAVPGQPEPVVPDENAPPLERPKPPVKIGKLDYQDVGSDSGKISLSGVGDPNIRVLLFFDEQPLGEVVIGSDGTWALEVEKKLGDGEHTIRADTYDDKTGMVAGRASVRIGREAAAEAAPATDVAAAPQDLSRQPQPVYPEAAGEAGQPSEEPAAEVAEAPTGTRPQPQPVYPDGPPADLDAPSSYAEVAPQPQDLSSQPQPVHPPEPAPAETAAAEPAPAEPAAPPPEPAPAEPSQAVTAETPSDANPAEEPKKAPVVFKSVDYQDTGAESGKVALAGTGEPGMRIFLYADQTPLGEVSIGSDGSWTFEGERKLGTGEHKFRADAIEPETGVALSSASIGIMRAEPPKEEVAAAPAAPTPPPSTEASPEAAAPQPEPEQETAAAEEAKPEAAEKEADLPREYTVRSGDTLWDIAEVYYGGGWRYRAIVRDNRRKIRNPHWIYPEQKFDMRVDK
jgi:nucleoid-associated protein YgaU